VLGLTADVRAVITDQTMLVVEFEQVMRERINWGRYEPYEAVLIDVLINRVSKRLQARVREHDIAEDATAMLADVLAWMEEGAG